MTDDSDDISSFIRGHSASWAQMASGEIGVTEDSKGWDARVKEYQYSTDAGREFFTDDGGGENAWCACFVNWSMEKTGQTGLAGYDGVRAKSWKDWGESSSKPYFGAVGVMKSGGTFHHVGFVVGTAGDKKNPKVVMLGGNQGDTVNISVFDQSKFLEYRLPTGYSGSKMEVHLSDVSGLSGGGSTR